MNYLDFMVFKMKNITHHLLLAFSLFVLAACNGSPQEEYFFQNDSDYTAELISYKSSSVIFESVLSKGDRVLLPVDTQVWGMTDMLSTACFIHIFLLKLNSKDCFIFLFYFF